MPQSALQELENLVKQKIENLRPKLLDLSRRNPLLSTKLSPRSNAHLRVVDELPEVLFYKLNNGQEMRFVALPEIDDDPKDEGTKAFKDALANARITDGAYLSELESIDKDADDFLDKERAIERALKDRVRAELSLPPRPSKAEINLAQHAKNNGITPSYDLPALSGEDDSERHNDDDIQTLLLPKDLERKLNNISTKCRTWMQETGINVLHVAYGFLEWSEPNQTGTSFAPLILCAAQIEKRRAREGVEFYIAGAGDEPEVNAVLAEKMRIDFGIEIPKFEGGSVEAYFASIAAIVPNQVTWRVRRQVVIGVFPSARMAMYYDIDPSHPTFSNSDIVRSILGGVNSDTALPFAEEYNVDEPEIEKKVPFTVLDADSSQFSALVDLANGKNLAVEGPPGTGKSQTIVNAIASALADGKKVLFVAEKLAALNVVKSRLEAIGLGEFLLPLQAERSTRERVISSVRSRVEMRRPNPVLDYDTRLTEFKRVRSQLSEYIGLLAMSFENSGLTVHEILGKHIATGGLLEGVPSDVLGKTEIGEAYLSKNGLSNLHGLAISVEQALALVVNALPYWKGVRLTHADRFAVEELCDLAANAARVHRAIAALHLELVEQSINGESNTESLERTLQSLEEVTALSEGLSEDVLAALLEPNRALELRSFLARCDACLSAEKELRSIFSADLDLELAASLDHINQLVSHFSIKTLDVDRLRADIEARKEGLKQAKDLAEIMSPFVRVCPEASKWNVVSVGKMQRLISEAGREAILCRSPATNDPAALSILPQICAELESLKKMKAQLEAVVSHSVKVDLDELVRAIAILRAGNFFSNLFSEYRKAKRLAMGIVLTERFDKVVVLDRLELLASYRRREQELLQNPQAISLLGLRFRGVETDQKPFERLVAFYESVRKELSGPETKPMREFLRDADADDLELVPAISSSIPDATLETLQADLATAKEEIDKFIQAVDELQPLLVSFYRAAQVQPSNIPKLIERVRFVVSEREELSENSMLSGSLGGIFKGADTPSPAIINACDWALRASPVAKDVSKVIKLKKRQVATDSIKRMLDARSEAAKLMGKICEKSGLDANHFMGAGAGTDIASFLEKAASDRDGLLNHSSLATALFELRDTGALPFIEHHMEVQAAPNSLSKQLSALVMRKLAKRVYAKHGQKLSRYSGSKLDELRAALANQDREIIKLSRQHLSWKVHGQANPPRGNSVGKKSTWTGMALIENEVSKQQRFISVRDLTQRAGKALLEIKPCWMMSPLAVAQYAPKGMLNFDLCIIDEASQMPPEAAIGALLRCKQIMVVGDTNQLPPSSFFKKMVDDEETDEDDNVLDESILEMANATFRPSRRLRWHYRSRHSGLIKFSNRLVYEDNLIVFPSATEAVARMGVEFKSVEGLYKSGTNAIEARAIVDAALEFMRTEPNRSLGIVTLNQKQRDLILEEFEQALNRDTLASAYVEAWKEKNDGLEEFFIKNLENVQGDERDVIFIGTVYGPEIRGARVAQRFGPINGLAGKRRLNVLFSRAKEKIVTFSSMSAADILAEETGNAGVYMLKRWLEYCASGVLDGGTNTSREPDSDFEIFVMDQVKAMGYEPVPQVGVAGYFIDIGVRHPSWPFGFVLGIECDGATYHSAKSARDRDRLRQEVLEGLGWRFHRIWSTDWFNNPRQEAEKIRTVLSARMEELKSREGEFTHSTQVRVDPLPAAKHEPASDLFSISPSNANTERPSIRGVAVGDTVRVRYLDGDGRVLMLTISKAKSDISNGVVHFEAPIAKALLGAEEGDEVEVLNGAYVRPAVIEEIKKSA